jgi:hypothetical protein
MLERKIKDTNPNPRQSKSKTRCSKIMNTMSKLGPHTQTDRGTCPVMGLEFTTKAATIQGGGVRRTGSQTFCRGLCPSSFPRVLFTRFSGLKSSPSGDLEIRTTHGAFRARHDRHCARVAAWRALATSEDLTTNFSDSPLHCSKNGAAGGRPCRLATAPRRWPVARDRSPA